LVDYKNAFAVEGKIMSLLSNSKKLSKYKLQLHHDDKFGVDVVSTAKGYEDFAIEIESTQGSKWPTGEPYPTTWKKGFSVPARKHKFFERHPMSLFVKVNKEMTQAVVVPMAYIFSAESVKKYRNQTDNHFTCNDFYLITNAEHPALCFCRMEDLPNVIDAHFKHMVEMKRVNAKYTFKRPEFQVSKTKEN